MDNTRPSMKNSLEKRYGTQHIGGAFDAKVLPVANDSTPMLEEKYTKQSSMYVKGLDTTNYSDAIVKTKSVSQ